MAKRTKAELQKQKIEEAYWESILIDGHPPKSVYALCKSLEIPEEDFYPHYSSLDAIESTFWKSTVVETIETLEADKDYAEYTFDQKLLAFFYTYFTHVQKHRSRIVEHFPCMGLEGMRRLSGMRSKFIEYAEKLVQQGIEEGIIADRKQLNQLYSKGLFEHLKGLILFYRKDDSEKFQDTDAFIEKTVGLVVNSLSTGVVDSLIDVARFLVRKTPLGKQS